MLQQSEVGQIKAALSKILSANVNVETNGSFTEPENLFCSKGRLSVQFNENTKDFRSKNSLAGLLWVDKARMRRGLLTRANPL